MGTIRLGKRTDKRAPEDRRLRPSGEPRPARVRRLGHLPRRRLRGGRARRGARATPPRRGEEPSCRRIRPMKGVFYPEYVKRLHGTHVKTRRTKADMVEQVRADIRTLQARPRVRSARRGVVRVDRGLHRAAARVHAERRARSRRASRETTRPISERADLRLGVPQGARPLRQRRAQPVRRLPRRVGARARDAACRSPARTSRPARRCMKTILAPGLQGAHARPARLVLHQHPRQPRRRGARRSRESSRRKEVVEARRARAHPAARRSTSELYGDLVHKVRIDYYPPRGDAKEGWDNIDLFGWLGYPMQIKVNFLCRDSILAAPIVLDLALFLDLAQRAGLPGHAGVAQLLLQEPDDGAGPLPGARSLHPADEAEEHAPLDDGRGVISHLGTEYYD